MAQFIELETEGVRARPRPGKAHGRSLATVLEQHAVVVLVLLAVFGLALRVGGISGVGLAEDEVNKLEAVRAYARGDITQNGEHPMVMKALIFVSMEAARFWNERGASGKALNALNVSDEAALRFPNIVCGALTVFPLFLLTAAFFDRRTALLAAALWATGVNAITYNRIAKEDTLLVFFMLCAFYFYLRAKQTSAFDAEAKRHQYILSGAAFGLMFASKYFPHYFGLNMLYHHFVRVRERAPGEPRGNTPRVFYVVVLIAFLVANPPVLFPQTWAYLSAYTSEQLLTHHGYLIGERLYDNVMSKTPFGATPLYFYLLFLLVKTPLPLLLALLIGLVEIARRRKEPGPAFLLLMFVLWIVPYSLAGAKWLRYTLSLMPFLYMIAAVGIASLARWASSRAARPNLMPTYVASFVGGAVCVVFVAAPAWSAFGSMPHYALYTNALAPTRAGYFFPHDEFYDDGLREAIKYACVYAPPGAILAHETPGVVRYYLEKFNRTDLRPRIISDPQFDVRAVVEPGPLYVILQRGRTYFENRDEVAAVRAVVPGNLSEDAGTPHAGRRFSLEHEVFLDGVKAAEVYRADGP